MAKRYNHLEKTGDTQESTKKTKKRYILLFFRELFDGNIDYSHFQRKKYYESNKQIINYLKKIIIVVVILMSADYIMKFCPFCGSKLIPNAKFCVECGKQLNILIQDNNNESFEKTENNQVNDSVMVEDNYSDNTNQESIIEDAQTKDDSTDSDDNRVMDAPEKKVTKSFSLLNQKNKSKVQKENNFELVRPSYDRNVETLKEETVNMENTNYPEQANQAAVNTNSNGLPCPMCGRNMQLTQTSGILSKSTHHQCNYCHLTFKENNNFLVLEDEPEGTRMRSKLHLKRYTYEQWNNILSGEFSPDFTDEFSKWNFDSATSLSCPACDHVFARYKGSGFAPSYYLICSGCGLTLKEHNNNQYTLNDSVENYSPLWKYEKNSLTLSDMKRIITTEESEETRLFRENIVKMNELKIKEYEMKVKQEEEDLALFAQSLESGKPLLPAPSDTTIVLKKNEVPVYKMYNITLSEPRAVRTSSGGYGGTSVRIAKGVTIHSGKTASKSESHDEIKVIDQGELLITNQRVIFLGSNRTTNIDMKKIIAITSSSTMIQIQRSNKQKPEYFNNIYATEDFQVDGRQYTVTIDGDMVKKLIMGLI